MTQKRQRTVDFDVPADKLFEILSSSEFLVAEQESDPGNESARYKEITKSDDRLKYELDITEYGRSMKGAIDRNSREQGRVMGQWDLKAKRCTWSYKSLTSKMADRFEVKGEHRIEPAGDKSRLTMSFEFSVRIPLMGKTIEKMILKEAQEGEFRWYQSGTATNGRIA